MKLKQYAILGVGILSGFALSVAGVSYASQNVLKSEKLITSEQAKSIMLNKVPGGSFIEFSYDGDDRTPKYDGTLIEDNCEYEVDVDAKTGKIVKFEKETIFSPNNNGNSNSISINNQQNNNPNTSNNVNTNISTNNSSNTSSNTTTNKKTYIGESKAKSIMLSKVPGATIKKFSFDNDSTPEYEAELVKGDYEYDISVDAYTGEIREFSKERIEKYDDDRYDHDDDDRYDD